MTKLSVLIASVQPMQLMERMRTWFEPPRVAAQTEEAFRDVWKKTARAGSTRHPFHREVLDNLDALLDTVAATLADELVRVDGILTRWENLAERHPWVARRLTPEWMRTFVVAEVVRVSAVADSTDYLTARAQGSETRGPREHELTVQHRLSGLRAHMSWNTGDRIGLIFAKSYSTPSIDPDRRWPHEGLKAVDQWEGLGITSRLYLHGAALEPDLRWGVTTLTKQSAALRHRLHRNDPWRFAAADNLDLHPTTACLWCVESGWAKLERTAFELHP